MKKEVYTCDVCGAERKEANHWWVACTVDVRANTRNESDHRSLTIYPWPTGRNSQESSPHHLCGQVCVHKFVDEYMSK